MLGALALQAGAPFVSQVAVLLVLLTIPLGALAIQAGPRLTRRIAGRRVQGPPVPSRPAPVVGDDG